MWTFQTILFRWHCSRSRTDLEFQILLAVRVSDFEIDEVAESFEILSKLFQLFLRWPLCYLGMIVQLVQAKNDWAQNALPFPSLLLDLLRLGHLLWLSVNTMRGFILVLVALDPALSKSGSVVLLILVLHNNRKKLLLGGHHVGAQKRLVEHQVLVLLLPELGVLFLIWSCCLQGLLPITHLICWVKIVNLVLFFDNLHGLVRIWLLLLQDCDGLKKVLLIFEALLLRDHQARSLRVIGVKGIFSDIRLLVEVEDIA